jgi:hypothetical protein
MTRINILDKKKCIFKAGEKLNFKLSLHSYDNLDDINFRFEVRYLDDTPIGTAQCSSLPNAKKDEDIYINMSFDTSCLTRGKYKALFVIYGMNEYGTYFDYDAIYPTFIFEIEDNNQINWNSNHWGHIRFKDIEIL